MPFHPLVLTLGNALYLFYADTADQPNFQATSCSSSTAVSQNSAQRKGVSKQKSANWTKEETDVLLQACRPNHEKLKTAASKEQEFAVTFTEITKTTNDFNNKRT